MSAWSRSQKAISLSSCEAEFLAAAGGAAESIQIKDLWEFLSKRIVKIRSITDSTSCRAFAERLGVGRLKHIDTRYLWMQLEVKKEVLTMDGIPTLWNVSDLGTKRLTRQRREFLMHLIGVVELQGEGQDDFFSPVGESAFNEIVSKKVMAQRMKVVKKEMVRSLVADEHDYKIKIPTNMVRAVTLLLLQPGVLGLHDGNYTQSREKELGFGDYLWSFQWFFLCTMAVFICGMIVGYKYCIRLSILVRTALRFFRQEITMELQRQQDERMFREGILRETREQEVRDRRSGRDMLLRAQMWSMNNGEWTYEGRTIFPEPLQQPDRSTARTRVPKRHQDKLRGA